MDAQIRAKLRFLDTVKQTQPALYRAALQRRGGGLSGLGETVEQMLARQDAFAEPVTSNLPWYTQALNSAIDAMKQLAPAYVGIQQARTCLQINAERAKQGLDPIDCASGGLAPQVSVGISPDTRTMIYAALGIGALWLFMRKK